MILQVIVNGILAGLTWGLLAVGFTLIYRVVRFFHVAYVTTYMFGAYAGVWLIQQPIVGVVFAALIATCVAVLIGCVIELAIYRPLRRREASNLVLLLASLAVVVVGQNLIALLFGSEIQVVNLGELQHTIRVAGMSMTIWQVITAILSVVLSATVWFIVSSTAFGKALRAVAADRTLATAIGVRGDYTIFLTVACGSALAGIAGFLVACDTAITPSKGFAVLLTAVTAAIIGGIGSIRGAMLGGLLVGVAQHLGVWKLPAQWQDAIVFLILLFALVFMPQGLFGTPLKKASV